MRKIYNCGMAFLMFFSFKIGRNSKYKIRELIEFFVACAVNRSSPETTSKVLKERKEAPSADRVHERARNKDWKETLEEGNRILSKIFKEGRKYERSRKLYDIGMDTNRIMTYKRKTKEKKDSDREDKMTKGKAKDGTHYAYTNIGTDIINDNDDRYRLCIEPVFKNSKKEDIVKKLINVIRENKVVIKKYFSIVSFSFLQ